jgi:hypothetical protein
MHSDIQHKALPARKNCFSMETIHARHCLLIAFLYSLTMPATAQVSALTEQLLDDCSVMTGKTPSDVFQKAMTELRNAAKEKEGRLKLYAQITNNRFACFEEEISGDAGWSVSVEPSGRNGVSESRSPLAAKIEKNPKALEALRESVSSQRLIADSAPDYGLLAARQMLKYLPVYQAELPEIYTLAGNAAAVYCHYARPKGIRQDWKYLCSDAKQIQNGLMTRLDKATRDAIDTQTKQWASAYAQEVNYQLSK